MEKNKKLEKLELEDMSLAETMESLIVMREPNYSFFRSIHGTTVRHHLTRKLIEQNYDIFLKNQAEPGHYELASEVYKVNYDKAVTEFVRIFGIESNQGILDRLVHGKKNKSPLIKKEQIEKIITEKGLIRERNIVTPNGLVTDQNVTSNMADIIVKEGLVFYDFFGGEEDLVPHKYVDSTGDVLYSLELKSFSYDTEIY